MSNKWMVAFAAIWVAACSAPADTEPMESRAEPIVGGTVTSTCAWPTTVSFTQGNAGCTATLVHPKLIIIVDHCLEGTGGQIAFIDSTDGKAPCSVDIQRCVKRAAGVNGGEDFAV